MIISVPLAEELTFRQYLVPRLISADFTEVPPKKLTIVSVVVSSIAFGLFHDQWIAASFAGAVYAGARARRGLLADAIVAHATTNALITVTVLVLGRWDLWM